MDHQRKTIKRLIGLPGDWVSLPEKEEVRKIQEGHCWVEGDNCSVSWDSRAYGPVRNKFYCPLGNFHLILSRHLDRQNCNQVSVHQQVESLSVLDERGLSFDPLYFCETQIT